MSASVKEIKILKSPEEIFPEETGMDAQGGGTTSVTEKNVEIS